MKVLSSRYLEYEGSWYLSRWFFCSKNTPNSFGQIRCSLKGPIPPISQVGILTKSMTKSGRPSRLETSTVMADGAWPQIELRAPDDSWD